jgi:RNA polymerase sigma-70 factor (ECF subfamily)
MNGIEGRDRLDAAHTAGPAVPNPHDADAAIIGRAQQGDVEAFETLYRGSVGRIHALCLRLAGDATRAEDLVQEVYLRAWERLGTFQGRSQFSTWLYRLAVNRATDVLRSEIRRSQVVVLGESLADLVAPAVDGPARGAGLDLEAAIRVLPAGARLVFVLHDVEGYDHEEIATMTGVAVGTSKSQLYRARKLLREHLSR